MLHVSLFTGYIYVYYSPLSNNGSTPGFRLSRFSTYAGNIEASEKVFWSDPDGYPAVRK